MDDTYFAVPIAVNIRYLKFMQVIDPRLETFVIQQVHTKQESCLFVVRNLFLQLFRERDFRVMRVDKYHNREVCELLPTRKKN